MDKNYIVTKSNRLINCNYDLSLQEQKIILTLASMVQPQDTEFKEYEFRIKDFIKLLGVEDKKKYIEIPKITKELMKKVFEIKEDKDIIQLSWLSSARYKTGQGIVILSFDKCLKPYMLGLKELYTTYKLENVLSLKSKYSIRLYEILKSNLFKNIIEIEFEELKKMVGATEKTYNTYGNLKSKVLIKSQRELKGKTDISFDFEEIKTGRKVTSIKFYINQNKARDEIAITSKEIETDPQQDLNLIKLTKMALVSSEISGIWNSYMGNSLAVCMLKFFVSKVDDSETCSLLEHTLDLSNQHIQVLKNFFTESELPIPDGFTDDDVNMDAPRLFTDEFYLLYLTNMARTEMLNYTQILSNCARSDTRDFFTKLINESSDLYNK